MANLNTSYERKYVVVSKSTTSAVLRVADEGLYHTYWKEFISADVEPKFQNPMILKIEQVPNEITLIDQFSDFTPDIPLINIEVNGKRYDITRKVAVNIPNTEIPGLFRLDYRVNFTNEFSSVFWESYVSIQQRPLLRKAAAGWTRDSYITRTLNRLIMEPQFMEALHAAGEPLYGFMQGNQHPSIRAAQLTKYADAQVWGSRGVAGGRNEKTIFVTGLKLPQGSVIVYQKRMLQLQEPVFPDVIGDRDHMDPETHERAPGNFDVGSVYRYGKMSYVCISPSANSIPVNNADHWCQGYLYRFSSLEDDSFEIPYGRLPVGKGGVEHIWVTVDNLGYPFWVDIAHITSIGAYRGHYNKKDFADYNSDDLVSYINDGFIRLFARKRTDIQDESTLIYPPGNYRNPAWEEVYRHMPEDYSPLLSEYYIIPHTNATNAVVAKTWSVSEEMCMAYSHMVGIPQSIMEECGAKWSALLFALLTRTRNTFDGLRICMRAVGLDVENLTLSDPSISYYCQDDNETGETLVEDIYTQHENLRKLVSNISTLEPFGFDGHEEEGALRYDPDDSSGNSIQQYTGGEWVTRYRFAEIEPAQNLNNRYYDGDIDVLARLAEDAVKDLGDGKQWVKAPSWAGKYSALVGDVITYEIPIYVWVRLHMHLYDESRIETETAVYSGVLDGQRCGGSNIIELFPSLHFNRALHDFIEIPTGVFTYKDDEWVEVPPTRSGSGRNSKIYEFDQVQYPIRIMALDMDRYTFIRYWQSTHTFGLLGLVESDSTDHFHNVMDPGVTDESELMLANGYVGITALYAPKGLYVQKAEALRWMYVLNDAATEETWKLSDTEPFVDWEDVESADIYPFEGTISEFKEALDHVTSKPNDGFDIPFEWDEDSLILKGARPDRIYFKGASDNIIGSIGIFGSKYSLTPADFDEYDPNATVNSTRISFIYH